MRRDVGTNAGPDPSMGSPRAATRRNAETSPPDAGIHLGPPALTPEQLAQWQAGAVALRKATRAAGAARFSGWTMAIFAVLTALGGMLDPISMGTAIALAVIAWSEFKGARGVRALSLRASRRLVINQIAILALIVVYAGVSIARSMTAAPIAGLEPTGEEQVDRILSDVTDLTRLITVGVYGAVLVLGVPLQGLMILYHVRRGRQMRRCLEQTPPWIVQMTRAIDPQGASVRAA